MQANRGSICQKKEHIQPQLKNSEKVTALRLAENFKGGAKAKLHYAPVTDPRISKERVVFQLSILVLIHKVLCCVRRYISLKI